VQAWSSHRSGARRGCPRCAAVQEEESKGKCGLRWLGLKEVGLKGSNSNYLGIFAVAEKKYKEKDQEIKNVEKREQKKQREKGLQPFFKTLF
jgi:hypothetical protein